MTKSEINLFKRLLDSESGMLFVRIMPDDTKALNALDRAGLVQIIRDSIGVRWVRLDFNRGNNR